MQIFLDNGVQQILQGFIGVWTGGAMLESPRVRVGNHLSIIAQTAKDLEMELWVSSPVEPIGIDRQSQ